MEPKLYAFWRYGSFLGVLGGPVAKMREDGFVQVTSYGPGNWFRPIKLLPLAAGKALHEKLLRLEKEHEEARATLDADFQGRIDAMFCADTRGGNG